MPRSRRGIFRAAILLAFACRGEGVLAASAAGKRRPSTPRREAARVEKSTVSADSKGTPALPEPPRTAGWAVVGASLLLRPAQGGPTLEFGLGEWEEAGEDGLLVRKRMLGDATRDGRFAWHWEKTESLRRGRQDSVVSSSSKLSYLGTAGSALWTSESADAPPGIPPLLMSRDGEWALLFEREGSSWTAAAVTFIGNRVLEVSGPARIERAELTPDGRFALLLWRPYEKPLVCTLLDLQRRARKDIPAAGLPPGEPALSAQGTLSVEGRPVFRW